MKRKKHPAPDTFPAKKLPFSCVLLIQERSEDKTELGFRSASDWACEITRVAVESKRYA